MGSGKKPQAQHMEIVKGGGREPARCGIIDVAAIPAGVTDWDEKAFRRVVSTELSAESRARVVAPARSFPQQETVLAVHWHPEYVPLELIRQRLANLYRNRTRELIIPTQHNEIVSYDGYAGVEVDCYSRGFNRKVQLLLHFKEENLARADTLRAMCEHTFRYRSSQLYEFIDSVVEPAFEERAQKAAAATNTEADVIAFTRLYCAKVKKLLVDLEGQIPRTSAKNKLLRDFFDELRALYDDRIVNKAQVFLRAVKALVKEQFSLSYFYRATEFIEEARAHQGGIVIPHPEQFWPILLADYDVDGIEVWNPQSSQYTDFLIHAVNRQNTASAKDRKQLIFMGDDCHLSEKLKDPRHQDPEKAGREIGLQPAWDDLAVRKSLILCNVTRRKVIEEYKARLG
jgi:hypothetical protein